MSNLVGALEQIGQIGFVGIDNAVEDSSLELFVSSVAGAASVRATV